MPDTGSNPFAEPDFSALHAAGAEDASDDGYNDDDVEDLEDEFDDEELDEGDDLEEVDDLDEGEPPAVQGAVSERREADEDAGNRVAGGTARSVLEHLARSIVDDPEGVAVEVSETRSGIHLALHVAQGDMGRIIGRRGRTAQALRTLVRAAAARDNQEASVDIVD
jgi:predicted RNA-binding protein YlqC (UPF0109 family)